MEDEGKRDEAILRFYEMVPPSLEITSCSIFNPRLGRFVKPGTGSFGAHFWKVKRFENIRNGIKHFSIRMGPLD
jgi:hypothetical protein